MAKKAISVRARKYIKNKASGMSDYQSAIKAGYSEGVAIQASSKLEKGRVKVALDLLMDKKGLTDEYLLDVTKDGLQASKLQRDYETGELTEVKDYQSRHKYLETALKLKGHLDSKNKQQFSADKMQINFNLTDEHSAT